MKDCKRYPVFKWKRLLAVFGEVDDLEKHQKIFSNCVRRAIDAESLQVAENSLNEGVKCAEESGLCAVLLDTSGCNEQTIVWGPWYGAACKAIADRDTERLQMLITGMQLANVEKWVLFKELSMDLNCVNSKGETSLIYAAKRGYANRMMYNALLSAGADPNICDKCGNTALFYAIQNGNNELICKLLKAGANPNKTKGGNLLEHAWRHKNGKLIRLLLEKGARFEWEDGEEEEDEEYED